MTENNKAALLLLRSLADRIESGEVNVSKIDADQLEMHDPYGTVGIGQTLTVVVRNAAGKKSC